MDVNRAQGIAALTNNSGGQKNPHKDQRDPDTGDESHELPDAYEIGGLAAEVTPAVQQLLDDLASEIEPLRAQLAMAHEREHQLREDLANHAFLPVPGRREFLRELNHVLNHLADLTAYPSIALVHIASADNVRRAHGREALDRYLSTVASELERLLLPTDVLGNLGGNDFALILLGGDVNDAPHRLQGIADKLSEMTISLAGGRVHIEVLSGLARLAPGQTADAAIRNADASMPRKQHNR